ncbi:MAG: PEP/pyruvate-binding domain-containing protein [Clostridia bacterium]
MLSLVEFLNYKNRLECFIEKKTFINRLLIQGLLDKSFADDVNKYLDIFSKECSSNKLDKLFYEIREKTIFYKEINSIDSCLKSLAYYYFLEALDEYSKFSNDIIDEIKLKYGADYLKVIEATDKMFLSIDAKKNGIEGMQITLENDMLKKYIVLKKWQDMQHYFFEEGYWQDISKSHTKYVADSDIEPFMLEQVVLNKRLFDILYSEKVWDLELCSILTNLYIKDEVIKHIGGKMYGLAVLNGKKLHVPYTVVVPVDSQITQKDITFLKEKKCKFAIRSSGDIEDGTSNSFAGMFDSYLDVSYNDVLTNYHKVKESANNERIKKYIEINSLENPKMAVIIQAFEEPEYAGVWIGNSINTGILEWVDGNAEKLVSGANTPTQEIWNGIDHENYIGVLDNKVGNILIGYQQLLGVNADFEWMILKGQLVMLQYRPVTKIIEGINFKKQLNFKNDVIQGIAASSGEIVGKPKLLNSYDDEISNEEILLARITEPEWLPKILKAKGLVTARGGILCHSAIVCRELGIPCVTGVGDDNLKYLAKAKLISIDGKNGIVKIVGI